MTDTADPVTGGTPGTAVAALAGVMRKLAPFRYAEAWPSDDPNEVGPFAREEARDIFAALRADPAAARAVIDDLVGDDLIVIRRAQGEAIEALLRLGTFAPTGSELAAKMRAAILRALRGDTDAR